MRITQRICFIIALVSVLIAAPLGMSIVWTENYDGLARQWVLTSLIAILGCLTMLIVIQAIIGRGGGDAT